MFLLNKKKMTHLAVFLKTKAFSCMHNLVVFEFRVCAVCKNRNKNLAKILFLQIHILLFDSMENGMCSCVLVSYYFFVFLD